MTQEPSKSDNGNEFAMILAESKDFPQDITESLGPVETIRELRGLYRLVKKIAVGLYVKAAKSGKISKNLLTATNQMHKLLESLSVLEKGESTVTKTGKAKKADLVIEVVSNAYISEEDKEIIARQYLRKLETIDAKFEEVEQNGKDSL